MKLVSVIIPVYNAQDTIQEALDSALNQRFPKEDFEVIVVNDGSTDKTLEVLKTYKKRIKIINQKKQGAVKSANKGFKIAKGKYVIKLDADDYFAPNILKKMVVILDKKLKINFVYCDYYEKIRNGKIKRVSTENIFNTLSGGIMFRKKDFLKEGLYRQDIKFPEYDLLLKTKNKWQGYRIPTPLYFYNRRKESLTGQKRFVEEALTELKKLHPKKMREIQKIRKY